MNARIFVLFQSYAYGKIGKLLLENGIAHLGTLGNRSVFLLLSSRRKKSSRAFSLSYRSYFPCIKRKRQSVGQAPTAVLGALYGIISYSFSYYGEIAIAHLGMTAPMAMFSFIAWIKHPFKGKKSHRAKRDRTITNARALSRAFFVNYYRLRFRQARGIRLFPQNREQPKPKRRIARLF